MSWEEGGGGGGGGYHVYCPRKSIRIVYTIVKLADNYKDTLMDTDEVNLTQRYFG